MLVQTVDGRSPQDVATASRRVTAVLACAAADARSMVAVVRALVADGARVELVAGVDTDVRPLEAALDRRRGPTLWVLCAPAGQDPRHRELLSLTIRAHEIAAANFVSATFDPADPDALVALLRPRLRQLADETSTPGIDSGILRAAEVVAAMTAAAPPPSRSPAARAWHRIGLAALALSLVSVGAWLSVRGGERASASLAQPGVATGPSPLHAAEVTGPAPARAPRTAPVAAAPASLPSPTLAVDQALMRRDIRALDALLVREVDSPRPGQDAAQTCAGLSAAGIERWRLPTSRQLAALGSAGFLEGGQRYAVSDTKGRSARQWTSRGVSKRGRGPVLSLCVADVPTHGG
jgi:hypothetical protein